MNRNSVPEGELRAHLNMEESKSANVRLTYRMLSRKTSFRKVNLFFDNGAR